MSLDLADVISNLQILVPASVVFVLASLLTYMAYSGLFSSVEVSTKEPAHGDMTICYKTGQGPYKNTGELFRECQKLLPNRMRIGVYYDDPETVPEDQLRFAVGVIMAQNEEIPDADELHKLMDVGYKIAYFPKAKYCVTVDFPFRTALSIYIAIFRVYPKLKEYIFAKGLCAYPAIEIYSDKIEFMMPLSRQEEFFVPEFSEELASNATTEMSSHVDDRDASVSVREASVTRSVAERRDDDDQQPRISDTDGDEDHSREDVFVRPERPAPKRATSKPPPPTPSDNSENEEASSTSSFEDLAPEVDSAEQGPEVDSVEPGQTPESDPAE